MRVLRLEKSNRQHKKYVADVVIDGKTYRNIHFGDSRYQQFKDSTPLKLYSELDHLDNERRLKYHQRHISDGPASLLSKKFLW